MRWAAAILRRLVICSHRCNLNVILVSLEKIECVVDLLLLVVILVSLELYYGLW